MLKEDKQNYYPLAVQKHELIETFSKKTKTAILALSISYLAGIVLFVLIYLYNQEYYYFALFPPIIGYCWLITFGAKNVNNHYKFKKISGTTMIYLKRTYTYSTYAELFVVIFIFLSIIRLAYEVKNYFLIKQTLLSLETTYK